MTQKQTYRDSNSWEIFAYDQQTWEKSYLGPSAYSSGVAWGSYSWTPKDISEMPTSPTIKRDGAWFQVAKSTPLLATWDFRSNNSTSNTKSNWGDWNTLRNAVTKIIGMKNNGNKDLTDAQAYWWNYARWVAQPYENENFNLLSPAQQSRIDSWRMSTADANLEALASERRSRDTLAWSALSNASDFYKTKTDQEQQAIDNQYKEREMALDEADRIDNENYRNEMLKLNQYEAWLDPYNKWNYDTSNVDIDTFMNAIWWQESWGDYNIENWRTEAYGKFQIMPENWWPWSTAYANDVLKESNANLPKTPENQEAVAKHRIQYYFNKFWNWKDVASAWYSGRPYSTVESQGLLDKKYWTNWTEPSVREYVSDVMDRMWVKKTWMQTREPEQVNTYNESSLKNYSLKMKNFTSKNEDFKDLNVSLEALKKWSNQEIIDMLLFMDQKEEEEKWWENIWLFPANKEG